MNISLVNKTALVSASTRGLGKAIALQLAASGAQVTLIARNESKLKAAVADLPNPHGQKHSYLEADFSEPDAFKTIISGYFNSHETDILVNNTQGPAGGTILEKDSGDYQKAFEMLFQTVVHITSEALPAMKKKGWGRIINVSSLSIRQPVMHLALSNIIRPATAAWAKNLALEVAPFGITVNNILTGMFDTERINELYSGQAAAKGVSLDEYKAILAKDIPARRFGKPEEYGCLAAFLASEQAGYITGANIPIDGGLIKATF